MITIREIAPGMFVVQCPIRGTFGTATNSRQKARQLVWAAAKAAPENWLNQRQFREALVRLGLEADLPDLAMAL